MSRSIRAAAVFVVATVTCLLAAQSALAGAVPPVPQDGVAIVRPVAGSNLTVVDPSRAGSSASYAFVLFGDSTTDEVVFGDWNGDGNKTIGLARQTGGDLLWIRDFTGNGSLVYDLFGSATDIPVVGNWDAANVADEIGVVRPNASNNTLEWILKDNTPGPGFSRTLFGADTDIPVPGEWDGDPMNGDEKGIARADGGALLWITEGSGGLNYALWGDATDVPVQGDYKGDGNTDLGIRRPATNVYILDGPTSPEFVLLGDATDGFTNPGNFGQP